MSRRRFEELGYDYDDLMEGVTRILDRLQEGQIPAFAVDRVFARLGSREEKIFVSMKVMSSLLRVPIEGMSVNPQFWQVARAFWEYLQNTLELKLEDLPTADRYMMQNFLNTFSPEQPDLR